MSCPDAAGTITSSPVLDVSITDRSAALPTAVPDVPQHCEYFMARHILCFHITNKFVLSLSHWPLPDSLNDVVQLQELTLSQSNLDGRRAGFVGFSDHVHRHRTRSVSCVQKYANTWTRNTWETWHCSTVSLTLRAGQMDKLSWGGRGELDQIHIYESYILPKHIVVIYNRYRLAASKTLNINVKGIYGKRNKLNSR